MEETAPGAEPALFEGSKLLRLAGAGADAPGTLVIAPDSIRFQPAAPGPGGEPRWAIPKLTGEPLELGVLWLDKVMGSTFLRVGHAEDPDLILLPPGKADAVKEALERVGFPAEGSLFGRAVAELGVRRKLAPLFLFLALLPALEGNPTIDSAVLGLAGVGGIVAGTRPWVILVFALSFLTLAYDHLSSGGVGFWFLFSLWISWRLFGAWRLVHPLARDRERWRWVEFQVLNSRELDVAKPPGYLARSIAFVLGCLSGVSSLLVVTVLVTAGSAEPFLAGGSAFLMLLAGWFWLLAATPRRCMQMATGVLPSVGSFSMIFFPMFIWLSLLGLLGAHVHRPLEPPAAVPSPALPTPE